MYACIYGETQCQMKRIDKHFSWLPLVDIERKNNKTLYFICKLECGRQFTRYLDFSIQRKKKYFRNFSWNIKITRHSFSFIFIYFFGAINLISFANVYNKAISIEMFSIRILLHIVSNQ